MRTFCIILGSLAAVLAFFSSFFLDTLAFIPVIVGMILGIVALYVSKKNGMRESVPKLIIALSFLAGAITTMNLFRENQVADDANITQEEKEKQQNEDLKEIDLE
ncbi:MAG: hypothetical protein AAF617_11725, partial [Bacteroidota bacterium]